MLKKIRKWFYNLFKKVDVDTTYEDINNFIQSQPKIDLRKLRGIKEYTCGKCGKKYLDYRKNHLKEEFSDTEVEFKTLSLCKSCWSTLRSSLLYHMNQKTINTIDGDFLFIHPHAEIKMPPYMEENKKCLK